LGFNNLLHKQYSTDGRRPGDWFWTPLGMLYSAYNYTHLVEYFPDTVYCESCWLEPLHPSQLLSLLGGACSLRVPGEGWVEIKGSKKTSMIETAKWIKLVPHIVH